MELAGPSDPEVVMLSSLAPPETAVHADAIRVTPWPDPVIDRLGYDPRSAYVERFWLPILGPSTTLLMRWSAGAFDSSSGGFEMHFEETARSLGLGGKGGRHGPFHRAIGRLVTFELARMHPSGGLAVRRCVPPLPRRHLLRLGAAAQEDHRLWLQAHERREGITRLRRSARAMALGLFALGDGYAAVETELLSWHLHPALASDATSWAWNRSRPGATWAPVSTESAESAEPADPGAPATQRAPEAPASPVCLAP